MSHYFGWLHWDHTLCSNWYRGLSRTHFLGPSSIQWAKDSRVTNHELEQLRCLSRARQWDADTGGICPCSCTTLQVVRALIKWGNLSTLRSGSVSHQKSAAGWKSHSCSSSLATIWNCCFSGQTPHASFSVLVRFHVVNETANLLRDPTFPLTQCMSCPTCCCSKGSRTFFFTNIYESGYTWGVTF